MDVAFGADAPVVGGLQLHAVPQPGAGDVGVGQDHLERGRLSLGGPDVLQTRADGDFSRCWIGEGGTSLNQRGGINELIWK